MGARMRGTWIVPFPLADELLQLISVMVMLNMPIDNTLPTAAVVTGTRSDG